jgi:hypothetical protein
MTADTIKFADILALQASDSAERLLDREPADRG